MSNYGLYLLFATRAEGIICSVDRSIGLLVGWMDGYSHYINCTNCWGLTNNFVFYFILSDSLVSDGTFELSNEPTIRSFVRSFIRYNNRLAESKPDWRWQLTASGRFAHRKEYVAAVGQRHGLHLVHYEPMEGFRHELGKDVRGHAFLMKKEDGGNKADGEL